MSSSVDVTYGAIFAVVLARQLCLPLPAPLILIGAGAVAAGGHRQMSLIVLMGILGCLGGDGVWFWMGRRWGTRIVRLICKLTSDPRRNSQRAHRIFDRWGSGMLAVAKFVPVMDAVMPPLAGAEGATISSFLLYDGMGALLWSGTYAGIGFVFHDQLGLAINAMQRFAMLLGIFLGIPFLAYVVWRVLIIIRMMSYLRTHRLTAATLARKIRGGERVAVVDLLRFEDHEEDTPGIPGAARIDPARLRASPKVSLPEDLNIVVYCSSINQMVSARVVIAMRSRGAKKVWILDGGLKAWQEAGFVVSRELYTAQELAERLGIELPEPASARQRRGSLPQPAVSL